jgi:hypothetical protein
VTQSEPDILKGAIQHIFDIYQSLFDKAKIYEIKKVWGVHKQVINYFDGYVKKMGEEKGAFLQANQKYICANVLLALNQGKAFKVVRGTQVEHDDKLIKTLHLNLDNLCSDPTHIDLIMSEPHKSLPYRDELTYPALGAKKEELQQMGVKLASAAAFHPNSQ